MSSPPASSEIFPSTQLRNPFVSPVLRCSSDSGGSILTPPTSPQSIASAPPAFSKSDVTLDVDSSVTWSPPITPTSIAMLWPAANSEEYWHRLGMHKRTFEVAQMTYPADAIVFVSNLPVAASDLELSDVLVQQFGVFGSCWVSVRRHFTGVQEKPYAYLQFSTRAEATASLGNPQRTHMRGRLLRVEFSNACRHVLVVHEDCTSLNNFEAHNVFGQFGFVEHVHHDTNTGGTVVRFRNYGSFLSAQNAVRRSILFGYKLL